MDDKTSEAGVSEQPAPLYLSDCDPGDECDGGDVEAAERSPLAA